MLLIPDKMYRVAKKSQEVDPISYLTHWENNEAFNKRKLTGRIWAGYRDYKVNVNEIICINETIFDNTPLTGFKIVKEAVRYSTSNVVWRVIDPRGFTVEIYSTNFMNIISHCTISEGEIQGSCIWGREAGKNFLIPEGSSDFKRGISEGTKSINLREVKIGSLVKLKDDTEAIYLGKYFESDLTPTYMGFGRDKKFQWKSTQKKRLAYLYKNKGTGNDYFHLTTVNNIIEIISINDGISIDDIIRDHLNDECDNHKKYKGHMSTEGITYIQRIPTSTNDLVEIENYVLRLGFKRAEDNSLIKEEE